MGGVFDERPPDADPVYKTVGGVDLRLYVFAPPKSPRGEGAPSILLFHGGGWNGGHPRLLFAHARYLAGRGMLAMSVEYRVAERHGTTPFECVADGRSAMRWVRRHAREFGGDPARVVAGGGSAGGHVAAATATLSGFDEAGDDLSVSPRPDALVLFNPVIDNSPAGYGHQRIGARWPDFSPLHNIRSGVPPAVVFLGTADHLIPVATVLEFQRRMQAAGARCDVWTYAGQRHGFYNYGDGRNPCYIATLRETDRFLASLGFLSGRPTLPDDPGELTIHGEIRR